MIVANDRISLPIVELSHDWELELGVVPGSTASYASVEEAGKLIAGYVIVNDIGTVDLLRRTDATWGYDFISKHQPGFKPVGPFIVPAPFVNRAELTIRLSVNGTVKQDWPCSDMLFSVEQILAYASERTRLMPGDLLLTRSPPGNGTHHGHFLAPGDLIYSSITGLGRQVNECVAENVGDRRPLFGSFR